MTKEQWALRTVFELRQVETRGLNAAVSQVDANEVVYWIKSSY